MNHTMEYNSQREELIISEYGRHVQNLIGQAKEIENLQERQAFVEEIVNLILIMTPENRSIENYLDRVWKDVFRIANYELEGVLPPHGLIPAKEDEKLKPEVVPYPSAEHKYRHYGRGVQRMVEKASAMTDNAKRQAYTETIAAYMKLAYRTWNNEQFVTDEVILNDLEALSEGKLKLAPGAHIEDMFSQPGKVYQQNPKKSSQGGRGNYSNRNKGGGNKQVNRPNKNRPKRK